MTLLAVLPIVLVQAVLAHLDHDDLHAIERTNRALATLLASGHTWAELVSHHLSVSDTDAPTDPHGCRRLACLLARPNDDEEKLLESVLTCSSMDREEESPSNTLELSQCWRSIRLQSRRANSLFARALLQLTQMNPAQVAQAECGCYGGSACYWSTTGSINKHTEDFVEYAVKPLSLVRLVQIIPYCAHWQPEHPTYGPVAVSVAFYKQTQQRAAETPCRELIYQSPVYPLPNEMKLHECVLPQSVWLPDGGILRLQLHGRYQNGTFENDTDYFYTTLSFVSASGVLASTQHREDP